MEHALADNTVATDKFVTDHPREGLVLGRRGLDLALRLGDLDTF